ncbi:MAG: NAD-dependent epimerase/dehydratase family protein [Helicobacteraceae bacterium]|jgi:nucleoside-diphosphate-sugar epimerase|nr:NAD-dependent epimerase/dehydratase family protein [Helicobacteraceae bacterium]
MNKIIKEDIENILTEPLPWEKLSGKTVLVTGASGVVASYFVYILMALGNVKVIANVRDPKKAEKKFGQYENNSRFSLLVQDIANPIPVDLDIDIIIHAASPTGANLIDFLGTINANVEGAKSVCEYARAKKEQKSANVRAFFFSSVAVYGITGKNHISESDYGVVDLDGKFVSYAESKRMAETIFKAYATQFGIEIQIARLASTYGPDFSPNNRLAHAQFIQQANEQGTILLDSDGSVIRPYTYVADVIIGYLTILFCGRLNEVYNVSNPYCDVKIIDLANIIAENFRHKPIRVITNAKDGSNAARNDTKVISIDSSKLIALGWRPKYNLKEGFARTVQSFMVDGDPLARSLALLMECARTRQPIFGESFK